MNGGSMFVHSKRPCVPTKWIEGQVWKVIQICQSKVFAKLEVRKFFATFKFTTLQMLNLKYLLKEP